jgi:hypothetical protein
MAAGSKARTAFNRPKTGIVDSNPAWGMDVCPRFAVVLPFAGSDLATAWPPSKEYNQMYKNRLIIFKRQIANRKMPEGLIRIIIIIML